MKKTLLLITAIVMMSAGYKASAQLSVMAEVNARSEFRNGFKTPILDTQDPAFFTEQRSRLYFGYAEEKFKIQVTLQDIRFWGATGQVYKADQSMTAIAEGWGQYFFNPNVSIKAGRQIISYDNQRFFGGLEWAMQGRRHDALLFMYEKEGFKLHIGGAFNQNPADGAEPVRLTSTSYTSPGVNAYHATGNYKHLEYLWANKKWEDGFASFYLVNDGRETSIDTVYNRQTYGFIGSHKLGGVKLDGELFYQGGEANGADVNAFLFSLAATFKTDATPITIGYDYLSGKDYDDTSGDNKNFAPMFGTNHAFYGFMDYFYVGNAHSSGLQDIMLKTKFKLAGGALLAHAHYFLSAGKIAFTDGTEADKGLGTEIDLVYVKKIAPSVTWKLGYSHMFDTDNMLAAKGIAPGTDTGMNNWAWTQIIFKPSIFKSK